MSVFWRLSVLVILLAGALSLAFPAHAERHFVILPPGTDPAGHGENAHQIGDLARLLRHEIRGGDVIRFAPGAYGDLKIDAPVFETPVRFDGQDQAAYLTSLHVLRGSNMIFDGFQVWPDRKGPYVPHLVRLEFRAQGIAIRNMDIRGDRDGRNYAAWSVAQWTEYDRTGVWTQADDVEISNNRFSGVGGAIAVLGARTLVVRNVITGFSNDGIRAIGDHNRLIANDIRDCVKISNNHDDGIQSWSRGSDGRPGTGTVEGLQIIGNRILEWGSTPVSPLRCDLQGIGLFDGMFRNLVIDNNVISVAAFHGIAVNGALEARITHNTVVNSRDPSPERPWIGLFDHKDGTPYRNVVMANNVAPRFVHQNHSQRRFINEQNLVAPYPARIFMDVARGDFRPRPESGLVDAANPDHGPRRDFLGQPRPQGAGPDIGAIEAR